MVPKLDIELGTMQFNGNLCSEARLALPMPEAESQDKFPKTSVCILDDRCVL